MGEFTPAPVKSIVTIAALDALDIRVGTIERVDEVPRSDKLMKLTVSSATTVVRFSRASGKNGRIRAKLKAARLSSS